MRNILSVMKNNLKRRFKKKSNIVVYLLSPILAVMVALVFNNMGGGSIKIGIYDGDGSRISKALVNEISSNDRFQILSIQKGYIDSLTSSGKIDMAVTIPEGFQEGVMLGEIPDIKVTTVKDSNISIWVENTVNYFTGALGDISMAAEGSEEQFFKIYDQFENSKVKISSINIDDKTRDIGVSVQSIGLLLVFLMAGAGITSSSIIGDKMIRTYQRITSSTVKKSEYILGVVLSSLFINTIQMCVILILSKTFILKFYMDSWIVFIILLTFSLSSTGLGLFIASIAKSSSQSAQLMNLIVVPTSMISGCFWPSYFMPEIMQKIGRIFPQWWVIRAFSDLQNGKTFSDVKGYLGMVLLIAIILFVFALFNMRTKDDTKSFI